MKLVDIGKTAEGRPMIMAIITSPENHKNLDRYKEISQKLARAEGLTDDQARGSPPKARPSSGSTAACTPPSASTHSSSSRWPTKW